MGVDCTVYPLIRPIQGEPPLPDLLLLEPLPSGKGGKGLCGGRAERQDPLRGHGGPDLRRKGGQRVVRLPLPGRQPTVRDVGDDDIRPQLQGLRAGRRAGVRLEYPGGQRSAGRRAASRSALSTASRWEGFP